ncbi:PBECR4 domain-containing protein [Streptococcus ovis]|uniref:PBECR4 domain-containing protein n=1 Tax=Streptococcus ovis TaxID=82806 RepID=UPI00036F98B6|nr:PBECR4 domain-containing protein [Streptococcus ovis]
MVEEHTNQPSSRGKSRRERVEHARSRDILDVANELHMELVRSGRDYRWKEHDSMVISPDKNMWNWFSRHQGGDVIALVQTMKEINFNQAIDYLNDGTFKEFAVAERVQESFNYSLKPYEQPFEAARNYLKEQRGLSDETIDFFLEKGVLAQTNAKVNSSIEPVVVFKSFDFSGEIVGATLQGIEENWEKWPERGYAKNIVRNSDGITGMHVDIGQPNRLIFAESAIDLMSYYELYKDNLQDVRLISMDGLKEGVIGRHLAQLQSELSGRPLRWNHDELAEGLQTAIDNNFFSDGKHADWITLAVDNDIGGRNFISSLQKKGSPVIVDIPVITNELQLKQDWNDTLKEGTDLKTKGYHLYGWQQTDGGLEKVYSGYYTSDIAQAKLEEALGAGELMIATEGYEQLKNLPDIASEWEQYPRPQFSAETSVTVEQSSEISFLNQLGQNSIIAPVTSQLKTYDNVKKENEEFVKRLENRIKNGDLSISFDTDVYLSDVFGNLGNSHPLKYMTDKRLEVLGPFRPILSSIDDKTVDLYKNKGTVEQESLYQALKPHQRTLGVDISTRFIGELAIASYSTNKQLESLSAEQFGAYYGNRTFDNLSQSIERMLEYPLNEAGIKDYTYGFVTTPNAFYHYLMEQEGEVVLSRSDVEMLMSRIESQSYQIVEPIQEEVAVSEAKEKSLEMNQETDSIFRQQKNAEGTIGDFPENQEAAPLPEANVSQPLNDLSPSQTQPQPLLHFSINEDGKSINKRHYHAVSNKDLVKLNRYAGTLQQAANWYLNELADSKIYYFYQENASIQTLQVSFDKDKFQHLTGVFPYKEGQSAEQTLEDFANGNGAFDTILLANKGAAFDKLKVLPELPAIVESDSFYFGDLSQVPKLHYLDLDKAIKSGDEDIILALRTVDNTTFPASLMKLRTGLKNQLAQSAEENIILGVYRERKGQLDQLSINEEYVKDGGQEMLSILENKQYEEALAPTQEIVNNDEISTELFTQVLDATYNVGDPRKIGTQVPEESKVAWERYYELSDKHEGNFGVVVSTADQMGLIDKDSNFYREWNQDRIYNENYHVRLQWAETWPDGPQLPFKETELVEYQTFAEELYKQNRAFYDRHQESLATGNQADYVPFTKVKFDVYAPGGILIKDNIRYDIGDETEPISRLLGLGYRRLEGQPELAAIDEKILSQLENQEVNLEIATEANEQSLKTQEVLQDEASSHRESFQSPNQEMKAGLDQRIEEIMAEESTKNQVKEGEQDYTVIPDEPFDYTNASAYEISEYAFQKIREYTQSPEDLLEYMDFMSKFPQLSPRNVALIHEQWRGANAVATYDQWQAMGEALGVKPEDVIQTKAIYTNKRTGETKEVVHQGLSVKTGEKSQITLFRPLMVKMIPVLDENGQQLKNDKGNPKFKKLSEATPQEKALVKDGKLPVRQFQERDPKTGYPRFTTYKVFELSQTTLKPESYPKAMPNRHYNFNMDKVKTKEVLEGLCDYAESLGVKMMKDEAHVLGNAKGAFYPGEQLILINPDNTPGEKIATTIHELAHATLHNPKLVDQYKELPKGQKELEAEMTSHILSKHFGLDTSEKAIDYMASWTDNLKSLDDKQLADSLKRVHKTVSNMMKQIENHTQPYQLGKSRGQGPNFPKPPTKGPSR